MNEGAEARQETFMHTPGHTTIRKSPLLCGKRYKNPAWLCYNKKHIGRRQRSRGAARPYEVQNHQQGF